MEHAGSAVGDFLLPMAPSWPRRIALRIGERNKAFHYKDVSAMACAVEPGLFQMQRYHVRVSTRDESAKGQTLADVGNRWRQPPNVECRWAWAVTG